MASASAAEGQRGEEGEARAGKFQLTPAAKDALRAAVLSAVRHPCGEVDAGCLQRALSEGLPKRAVLNAAVVARRRAKKNGEERNTMQQLGPATTTGINGGPPCTLSDAQLRRRVEELMAVIDPEVVTTNQFLVDLSAKLGGVDLAPRKPFIKEAMMEWLGCNNAAAQTGEIKIDGKKRIRFEPGSNGKQGTVTYPTGDVYEGGLKDGRPRGKGTYRFAAGNVYVGEFSDKGIRQGAGTMTWANGDVYVGQWVGGRMQKGTLRHENGDVYEGDFVGGKCHGRGTLAYAQGSTYVGEWAEGKRHGKGTFKSLGGSIVYQGKWMKGVPQRPEEREVTDATTTVSYKSGIVAALTELGDDISGSSLNAIKEHMQANLPNGEELNVYTFLDAMEQMEADGDIVGVPGVVRFRLKKIDELTKIGTNQSDDGGVYEGEGAAATDVAAPLDGCLGKKRDERQPEKEKREVYGERKLRSQESQQKRLHVARKTCENCGADDYHYKLRACSGCNLALYCSAACQKAASGAHRRICDIISELPPRDADTLILKYDGERMVDLDAGLRYGTKYMSNLKHLEIDLLKVGKVDDIERIGKRDGAKLSAKRLCSLFMSKTGELDSVSWVSDSLLGFTKTGNKVWTKLRPGLKQLRLDCMNIDDVQLARNIIFQQRNSLMVLCLPDLRIDWHKAKCRRTMAEAVSLCKSLVKLRLQGCVLMDSDLKIMLQDLSNLRVLNLTRRSEKSHEFTDKTCGLIARKCPGLQELDLDGHNQLSVRGIRKIFEGCVHLRSLLFSTCKLSRFDIQTLLDDQPRLLCLTLNDEVDLLDVDLDEIIERTGGRTLLRFFCDGIWMPSNVSVKSRKKYECQREVFEQIYSKGEDPKVANEWECLLGDA